MTYFNEIDVLLRKELKDRLSSYTEVASVEASEPYFVLNYRNKTGSRIRIILIYDIVKQTITVYDVSEVVVVPAEVVSPRPDRTDRTDRAPTPEIIAVPSNPAPTVNGPSDPPIAGGFGTFEWTTDEGALQAATFLKNYLGTRVTFIRIVRVLRQVVNGMNYQFELEVTYSRTVTVKYVVVIFASLSKTYEITRSEFVDLPQFNTANLRSFSSVTEVAYFTDIDALLRKELKDKLTAEFQLASIDAFEPYFVFGYRNKIGTVIRVSLIYNIVKQTVTVSNLVESTAEQPVSSSRKNSELITS